MKVLLSWLREFAPIEGDPAVIGEELSDLGLAVESMDVLGEGLDGIVVARVLDHLHVPNALVARWGEARASTDSGTRRA